MIVVDTNVIAYLMLPGDSTPQARGALRKDGDWSSPLLWRSEFRNILVRYLRQGHLQLADALQIMEEAERVLRGGRVCSAVRGSPQTGVDLPLLCLRL